MSANEDASDGHVEPRRWFIGIGVGDYDEPDLNLEKAISDVERMSAWFVHHPRVEHSGALEALGANPTWSEISRELRNFLAARGPDDVVIIYVACHGDFDSGEAYLFGRDTPSDRLAGVALPASEFGRMLGSHNPHNVLLIIDACVAGTIAAKIVDATKTAVRERNSRDPHRRFAQVVIASAYGLDPAYDGQFVDAFLHTVNDERWTGTTRPWISPEQLIQGLNAELQAAKTGQSAECSPWFNGEIALIPNPNFGRRQIGALFDDEEFAAHFDPAARGVSAREQGVFFTGRTAELRQLNGWLELRGESRDNSLFVITGSPGCGKSALLSRIAVLSKPELRPAAPDLAKLPEGTVPQANTFSGVLWCHGKSRGQMIGEIARILGGTATSREGLLGLGQTQGHGKIIAIDALDEAAPGEAEGIASEIIAPLARETPLRLLIATRRHEVGGSTGDLLHRLGVPTQNVLDLDEAVDRTADMVEYVRVRLVARDLALPSPTVKKGDAIDDLANAIVKAAGKSFLVASIAARSATLRDASAGYRLPAEVAEALSSYLDRLHNAESVRNVLRPLAWSYGAGQPWGAIWASLATALRKGDNSVSNAQIRTALDVAGDLVVEARDGSEPVYRLFHEALAEHLRETTPDRATAPARIAKSLLALADGRPWSAVPRYCRGNLPAMLIRAEMPDELARVVLDPAWASQQLSDGGSQDANHDIDTAASMFVRLKRPLDLAPLCHQYSRATAETLPPLIEVLALSGQQRRAELLAANLSDVADRMLAYRGLAHAYAYSRDYASAGRCAEEIERALTAMHPDHKPMAWSWCAEAFAAARNLPRSVECANRASAAVSNNDEWDRANGLFWSAMASRVSGNRELRMEIAKALLAWKGPSFRNQFLQAASVAGCSDILRRALADRLAVASDIHSPIRDGNLALALADAGMKDEMERLLRHLKPGVPSGEDDSLKRWVWALAISGKHAEAIGALQAIQEPIEYSKAIARISPIVARVGDASQLVQLRSLIGNAMNFDEPRTHARLVRALWTIEAHQEALAAVERAIRKSAQASSMVDTRAVSMRELQRARDDRVKSARRAMVTSRAPVEDELACGHAESAAAKGDSPKAREIAAKITVPQFKARALDAVARNEPDFGKALAIWMEALAAARRAGRGEVERILSTGPYLQRKAGHDDDASVLEGRVADVDAMWQLALFIDEYRTIRESMEPGTDRTRRFTSLMLAPVQLARTRQWSDAELRAAWNQGEDGSRLFVLGLMQGRSELLIPEILAEGIRGSRSAFEQYNALKAANNTPPDQPVDPIILQAIDDEIAGHIRPDGSRAWLEGADRRRLAEQIRSRKV